MHPLDILIIAGYLTYVVVDGLRRARGTTGIEGYFLANRSMPWWAVGLSVMATQLSAVTMIGTTGQGAFDGLRLIQMYFGLPIGMVLVALLLVPLYHRARVFTAYEYLEHRFDARTRALTSFLFLISRGLSCGTILSAPAVVFSVMLGWSLPVTVAAIGAPMVVYTAFGGVQAVTWADVKQMVIIVTGLVMMIVVLIVSLPDGVGIVDALTIAGSTGRLNAFDFRFSLVQTYTFWSGLLGGAFLMMSYFGTDQSQVQRYLTAKSVDEARTSLMMSAYGKIPLQVLVLMVGVMVFVYYVFTAPPVWFNPVGEARVRASQQGAAYADVEVRFAAAHEQRKTAARAMSAARAAGDQSALENATARFLRADGELNALRNEGAGLVRQASGDPSARDINYIVPQFMLTRLPVGLVGILIAAIMAAAMSSSSGELNALSTATVVDFYRRWIRVEASDAHYLLVGKLATLFWGAFACVVALYASNLGSLIEVVNRFGSFFYGLILGVFLLGFGTRLATARGAFVGLVVGIAVMSAVVRYTDVSFLWHNVIGAVTVVAIGGAVSLFDPRRGLVARSP